MTYRRRRWSLGIQPHYLARPIDFVSRRCSLAQFGHLQRSKNRFAPLNRQEKGLLLLFVAFTIIVYVNKHTYLHT